MPENAVFLSEIEPQEGDAVKVGGEEQVNTFISGDQDEPAIGSLSDGGYVIAWTSSGQDGSGDGVYAQRYDANGVLVGQEFLVNTTVSSGQNQPRVTGLDGGGFVVTWSDASGADGSGGGVFGQRYDANGIPVGSEFQANSTITSSTQDDSSVASLEDGGFVVTWTDQGGADGASYGVYGRRYDAAGVTQGGEFQVNTETSSVQYQSHVVGLVGGGFAVVWASYSQDATDTYGIFAQRLDGGGNPDSSEFQVNTVTASNQDLPRVAALSDGGMVVVWQDDSGQDGSGLGIYGQRYDVAGTAVGGEFRVNENTSGGQQVADVASLDEGGFVVSWQDVSEGDGSGSGVFGQQYDADGNRVDGEFQINTEFSGTQYQGVLAALPNGNFVAAWSADTSGGSGDGSSYGVFQQLFGDPADFSIQQSPQLSDIGPSVAMLTADVIAEAQIIDDSVSVVDEDSADFDGGFLRVYYVGSNTPFDGTDQLGVNNQGTGSGQIGVSGSNITYSGTTIGIISVADDGANDQPLQIDFNSNATAAAAQALVENLTYQSLNPAPGGISRIIAVAVNDGDGGNAVSQAVTISVVDTQNLPVIQLEDVRSSLSLVEDELQLAPVLLDPQVQFSDHSSAGFDGGTLTLNYQSGGGLATEHLAVRDEGNGSGQIGVSGSGISFGGILVGTVDATSDGQSGANLRIDFNANASEDAIEALIENLSYHNSSDIPADTRTLRLIIADGANNNTGTGNDIQILIDPSIDDVEPIVVLSGADSLAEGETYTLIVGVITGPNDDRATDITINWDDGSSETVAIVDIPANGEFTHLYADGDATPSITVDVEDEEGAHLAAGTKNITVNNIAPTVALSGANDVDEGSTYSLTVGAITDPGADTVSSYTVDWGDGSSDTISAADLATTGGVMDHVYADGVSIPTISVDLVDGDGTHTDAGSKNITVNNVAPDLTLNGAGNINTGQLYTLSLGNVIDPGADTVSSYIVDWGDGSSDTVAAADLPGNRELTHTYNTAANFTTAVDLMDEDGTFFDVDTLAVSVGTPASGVAVNAGGDTGVDEGDTFTRQISFTDGEDSGGDGWAYSINWGDGTASEVGDTAELRIDISRLVPDGDNAQTVSVTVTDDAGDSDTQSFILNTDNVAPTLGISGPGSVNAAHPYTLSLGDIVDPGDDTHSIDVDWGDGYLENVTVGSESISHIFADGLNSSVISATVTDDDGASSTASQTVMINEAVTIRMGDAPEGSSRRDQHNWKKAWRDKDVDVTHRANYLDENEKWTKVKLHAKKPDQLKHGDIYSGDLGVSGQSLATGSVAQEIEGREALRFELEDAATLVTVDLGLFFTDDDGSGNDESVRLQAFNAAGELVAEVVSNAQNSDGRATVQLAATAGFTSVVVTSGVYDGGEFVFGGLADATGDLAQAPSGSTGSDFLLEAIEFSFGEVAAPAPATSNDDLSASPTDQLEQDFVEASVMSVDLWM